MNRHSLYLLNLFPGGKLVVSTDQLRQTVSGIKERGLTLISNLSDADRRATYKETGRTVISQATALATSTAGTTRDAAKKYGPETLAQIRNVTVAVTDAVHKSSDRNYQKLLDLDPLENAMRQRKLVIGIAGGILQTLVSIHALRLLRRAAADNK